MINSTLFLVTFFIVLGIAACIKTHYKGLTRKVKIEQRAVVSNNINQETLEVNEKGLVDEIKIKNPKLKVFKNISFNMLVKNSGNGVVFISKQSRSFIDSESLNDTIPKYYKNIEARRVYDKANTQSVWAAALLGAAFFTIGYP